MNIKGSKKNQVLSVNIFEQQEIIAKAEAIKAELRELSKSAFGFSNAAEGFESMLDWSTKLAATNDKKQIVLGLVKIALQFQTLAGIQSLSGFGQGSRKETCKPDGV